MRNNTYNKIFVYAVVIIVGLLLFSLFPMNKPTKPLISIFPMQNYDQSISHWIDEKSQDYDQPLLTPSQLALKQKEWYAHNYGELSPWSLTYIHFILTTLPPNDLYSEEQNKLYAFDNTRSSSKRTGFGANFQPYDKQWINQLRDNIDLQQFKGLRYDAAKRGIAINNIMGRVLPTHEVHYYHHQIAGQGYPFDNLQASVIWAGTPLYVLGLSKDGAWALVLSPAFAAWVKTNDIAMVDENFVRRWQEKAQETLVAITKTNVALHDVERNIYRFSGFIGTVLPGDQLANGNFRVLLPVADENGQAQIRYANIAAEGGVLMPLQPTPRHFADIISQLIGRPYGWGSMYFYNDCASELKNLFSPFGIWLPIHSSDQADPNNYSVKRIELSQLQHNERIDYLKQHGHKFMTIVYIGGHVFLYTGTYTNPKDPDGEKVALSYQNIWGLRPENSNDKTDRRAVIGKAVLLPILAQYPEDPELASLAGKQIFQIIYLDEFSEQKPPPGTLNIQALLSP